MATFERYFITDKETHKEEGYYFLLRDNEQVIDHILWVSIPCEIALERWPSLFVEERVSGPHHDGEIIDDIIFIRIWLESCALLIWCIEIPYM